MKYSWAYAEGGRGGPWLSTKSLEENIYFSLSGKIKIINTKEDYRNNKNKVKERVPIMFLRDIKDF